MLSKRVLILDTGKEWGGGTNSLLELLKRLDRERFRFQVLFYNNYGLGEESDIKTEIEKLGIPFMLLKQETQSPLIKILKELVRTIFFFSKSIKKYLIFFIDYQSKIKKNAERLSSILKGQDIDLLYMNNQPSSNLEGIIAANHNGTISVLHSRIETKLNFFEIKVTNDRLTKMICNSEGVRKSFVKQGVHSSKCIVIYNGIYSLMKPAIHPDKIRRQLGVENDELLIGSAGTLIKRKRFDMLIDSVSTLMNDKGFNKIKCLIIGEGPEREFLQKRIKKNKLSDRIILAGFKSDGLSYINAMDIFVLASEREGFSKVILEAMLMGKPVISSRIAGPTELVIEKRTGLIFQKNNKKELSDCMLTLISSFQLRDGMGQEGRKRAIKKFSIEKYSRGVQSVFVEILDSAKNP